MSTFTHYCQDMTLAKPGFVFKAAEWSSGHLFNDTESQHVEIINFGVVI